MLTEADILFEKGDYWVTSSDNGGYEVFRVGVTHSVRCAIIGIEGERGSELAKIECVKRASETQQNRISF